MYSGEVMPIPYPDEWVVPPEVRSKIVRPPLNPRQAGHQRTGECQQGLKAQVVHIDYDALDMDKLGIIV
ncbi:hypothetical protein PTKIN_Ptkin15bG0084100 [Pterospermum kingtungense]